MAPRTAFAAAALLLSVSTAPSAEIRAAVDVPAPLTAAVPRAQEAAAGTAADAIAVIVFSNITGAAEDDWIGAGIAETLAADLGSDGMSSVVGRGAVPDAIETARSGHGPGAEAPEAIEVRAGRLLGARWIISGAYQRVGDGLRITARVVEVASGEVVHTAKVDGLVIELFALQDRLSTDLRRGLPAEGRAGATSTTTRAATSSAQAPADAAPPAPATVRATTASAGGGFAVAPTSFIDGPPPPVAPETIARDAAGRATVWAVLLDRPLLVDGELDEAIYDTVPPVSGFIQQLPDEGEPATERTEAWIFYDARNVYVSARNWNSAPESQWVANEMQRDSPQLINNDSFSVAFDTFYDRRNGVSFLVNPLGGIFDYEITDEGNPNRDWNPVWDVQTGRFEGGWTVEMQIPFKSLRFSPGTSQIWGLQIGRNVQWKNETTYLTPVPISAGPGMFRLSAAGTLTGIEVPEGNRTFEIKPYGIGSLATDVTAAPPVSNAGDGDFGVDVKYGLTQNLTADFTYNTDFAQVEVDDQQVNLTRFSLFFPEKREFFLEGRGIFDFGRGVIFGGLGGPGGAGRPGSGGFGGSVPTIFFSRRIGLDAGETVPILGGGRLTGKVGDFTVGALSIQTDDVPIAGIASTNFTVLRVKRDILRRSRIGGIFTGRSVSTVGDGTNQTFGLDAAFSFYDNVNVNGYYARTQTPGLDGDDDSYQAAFTYNGDRYALGVDHLRVGDNFNPEIGFLRRDDFRRTLVQAQFSPRPASIDAVRQFTVRGSLDYLLNGAGHIESRIAQASFKTELENSDQFSVDVQRSYELLVEPFDIAPGVSIPIGGYGFQNYYASYSMGAQRRVSGAFSIQRGGFFDGDITAIGYSRGRIEITPQLSIEPSVSFNRIELPEGRFTTQLATTRVTYTFTPRMFFSGLLQYNSSLDVLSTNLRLRWEYQPGSELFVVYNDQRDTELGRSFPMLENRAFVVKFTRLFRF